jgi:hypothetical protein
MLKRLRVEVSTVLFAKTLANKLGKIAVGQQFYPIY